MKKREWNKYIKLYERALLLSWELVESDCRRVGTHLLERRRDGLTDISPRANKMLDKHFDKILTQLINNNK
tara:strand:+ start:1206 stop:1418 length:213 start_codon:yes stop_codon:yes gene_type:complete